MEQDKVKLQTQLTNEINIRIEKLEGKIRQYGSFNIIANAIVRNQFTHVDHYEGDTPDKSPAIPEYLALICLKFPYSLGIGEFTQAREVPKDFHEIDELAREIVQLHASLHGSQFDFFMEDGNVNVIHQIAASLSAEELLVRNETFEEHHWERLETLYKPYNDYLKEKLGFTVDEAIRICLTIQDYMNEAFQESIIGPKAHAQEMYEEAIAYKYRDQPTKNFYPPEFLAAFKDMPDEHMKMGFLGSMATYAMVMMGHRLSFTEQRIIEMEELGIEAVSAFFRQFSLTFEEINPDFSMPEILHPLKDKPLIRHAGSYLCPSLSLLDYSLDRLFQKTLFSDTKKIEKYKDRRHDYLLETGMGYLTHTLKSNDFFTNLIYDGGELDGLIFCGNNAFFIEAKSHQITDRAKKGYVDRLLNHVEEIVEDSHFQAKRTYQYIKGKERAEFKRKNGSKVIIDGSKFKNAYFISLSLEGIKAISCNLKVGNALGLFDEHTFPWIVSLYDLRVVCEHMEGPAYLIQYMHRRREFFKIQKFHIHDELDLLYYYLERNMRFDNLLEKHVNADIIHLPSMSERFNSYYAFEQGKIEKPVDKMKHYTIQPIKKIVSALEGGSLPNSIDASVQILEFGSVTKKRLLASVEAIKKKFRKDGQNHDFRMMGDDTFSGSTWMFSYWVGPNHPDFFGFFEQTVKTQFHREQPNEYFALLDIGKDHYQFEKIINLSDKSPSIK